ncbi:threonine/serine ThrE exporter family protein [Amycolatopsis suaedae]|uniref:Threonine/serine exporter family protein n=1 Tax=Amycolatopsis suaedae TaxID=2510978 RepID=A0A4Q7J4F0_9PSEU|nr:threonine/serine exporter family protein [Amycolatopsis suaedae]RZQ61688.1 threonine/serine exporter family protein [Amycolatopsis suaedae]
MAISRRGRAAGPLRRAWHILEAPAGRQPSRPGRQDHTRAWQILEADTGEQPATETTTEMGPALPDESTVHFVLDLALRIGEVQMSSGAGASDVTATILALTSALGLPHCEVDVIFTSITVTCHRGTDASPVTALRVVRARGLDYTRLSETERLIQRITRGRISAQEAYTELQRITDAPHPYPRFVSTLAWGGMAACISLLIGGDWATALVAFVISSVVDRVGRLLNRFALPFFFQQVVGGLIATLSAVLIVNINLLPTEKPTLVVAAAITVLLSGLSTVSAVQDAITGYNVTAAGRTMEVGLMSAGLITGVALALNIAPLFAIVRQTPLPTVSQTALDLPIMVLAGAGAAACFALASYARLRSLLVAAAAGAVGAAAYGALGLGGADPVTSSAVAATLVGFCGGVLARRLRETPLVVAVSGITPLLPGLSTYRGLYEMGVYPGGELGTLMTAVAVGLALAAGVVLGEYLAQPVRSGLGRLERKLAGPRMAGPLETGSRRLD